MNISVYLEKYADEQPQLGMIKAVHETTITIAWYAGSYTGKWKFCMTGSGRNRKKWTETIPKDNIYCEVKLTPTLKLSKDSLLKDLYVQLNV